MRVWQTADAHCKGREVLKPPQCQWDSLIKIINQVIRLWVNMGNKVGRPVCLADSPPTLKVMLAVMFSEAAAQKEPVLLLETALRGGES